MFRHAQLQIRSSEDANIMVRTWRTDCTFKGRSSLEQAMRIDKALLQHVFGRGQRKTKCKNAWTSSACELLSEARKWSCRTWAKVSQILKAAQAASAESNGMSSLSWAIPNLSPTLTLPCFRLPSYKPMIKCSDKISQAGALFPGCSATSWMRQPHQGASMQASKSTGRGSQLAKEWIKWIKIDKTWFNKNRPDRSVPFFNSV